MDFNQIFKRIKNTVNLVAAAQLNIIYCSHIVHTYNFS